MALRPDASSRTTQRRVQGLRSVLGYALVGVSGLLLAAATLLTFELTRMYGYSPNDDPSQDLTQAALGHTLGALLVSAVATAGVHFVVRLRPRRQLLLLAGAFAAALAVLALGMAAGQWTLNARCAGPDRYSTAAC